MVAVDPAQPARALAGRRPGRSWGGAHLLPIAVTAGLLALAFPWPGWWPVAYFALVPAGVAAVRSQRPWVLLAVAAGVFTGWFVLRLTWLYPVTVGGTIGLSTLMGVETAGGLWLLWWLVSRYRLVAILALPLAWTTMELVRANFLAGGFGWFMLGHTQAVYTPGSVSRVVQMADLFGEQGVTFYVAMTNGLLVDLLTRPLTRPGNAGRARLRRSIRAALLLWPAVTVCVLGYGHFRISQTPDHLAPGPVVAVVQTAVPQSNRNSPTTEQRLRDWEDLLDLARQAGAAAPRPDVIVWPESSTLGPVNPELRDLALRVGRDLWQVHQTHATISDLAASLGTNLVVGAVAYDDIVDVADGVLPSPRANAVQHYTPDGRQDPLRYDKQHLVPFGEYIPWVDAIPGLKRLFLRLFSPYGPDVDYTVQPGRRAVVFTMPYIGARANATFTVAPPVCYEDVAPAVVRAMVYSDGRKRADLITNVTNSAWYAGRSQRWQHLQIATLRSVENRVPSARSVNTGISGFIDSVGRVGPLVLPPNTAGIARQQVQLDDRRTLFGVVGRWPVIMMALLTAVLAILGRLRPAPHTRRR